MKLIGILQLLFCIFLCFLMFSCNFFVENGGGGVSWSIIESKERGVFIRQYKAVQNPCKINDTLLINVKSAWLEHQWSYAGSKNEKASVDKNGYQLIVVADEKSLKGYNENWIIGVETDSVFNWGYGSCIVTEFNRLPQKDTIHWKVQKGTNLMVSGPRNVIGKFLLVPVR